MNRFKIGSTLNAIKNSVCSFHVAIIASFLLIISTTGCGYKTAPVWVEKDTKVQSVK